MLAHSINRGVSKKALPRSQLPPVLSRSVSNWGRRRWPRWREDMATDEEWKQFRLKMERFQKQVEQDPYDAIFGRSNELLRGVFRSPAERQARKTVPINEDAVGNASQTKARKERDASPAGSTLSSRQSATPPSELRYDPVSGRMVPTNAESSSIHYSQKHHDPRDDALKAFDEQQKNTTSQSSEWLTQEGLQDNLSAPTSKQSPESSGTGSLQDCLAEYDKRMRSQPQKPPAPLSEWLVQEEPRKPKLPEDDIDLMTTADVRARMGISRFPAKETEEQKRDVRSRLEESFNNIQEEDSTTEARESLEARKKEADELYQRRKQLDAEYAAQQAETQHSERLETSLSRTARQKQQIPDDGYSRAPMGLQTSFEREKASGNDLATDIEGRTTVEQYDDGYSREPMGLQTSFEKEQAAGRSLAEDIQAKTDPENYIVEDGYSRKPMGLETAFEREKASGFSLEEEIKARSDPQQHVVDDGYSRQPTGLETSFQREVESGRSLEEEILARDETYKALPDDPCSKEPTGLESSYARELEAVNKGEKKSLEEELKELSLGAAPYSDVCSSQAPDSSASSSAAKPATAPPRSVEQRRKHQAAPDEVKDWYGYSLKPLGLQTSYEREVEACRKGERKSLEEELVGQASCKQKSDAEFDDQGFSLKPMGLETSYQRELEACANGKQKSLEEHLATPVDGGAVETLVAKEEAAKLATAREQRLRDISLVREVREIYEKFYGKITDGHRQAKEASTSTDAVSESEGRVDETVHQSLSHFEKKNPGSYNFTPDNLEAELAAQTQSTKESASSTTSQVAQDSASPTSHAEHETQTPASTFGATQEHIATPATPAKPRIYKLLAFDRTTKSLTTSQTSSTIQSPGERPIPLSVALSNLEEPAKFVPQLTALQREGYEPVASTANLLILRLRDDKVATKTARAAPRANPVDGTTIPLPPTPTMSPTGYINLDPVMENPAARRSSPRTRDDKKVRKTEPVFSGEKSRREGSRGQSVKTVLTTLIWATAACYVAGVAGEVAKGY